ncbi:MAG TPA: Omp28-related outer membrane protein [Bacteroidales bacterium]|nr:Omp28-related outer membrane protein [Bacteroidales bacterium]HSA44748.1 Omp28-related outer membrane protein [Bacteroidales bacterium]
MKFNYIKAFLPLLSLMMLYACDKIEEPYARDTTPGVSKGRKVLLEEYTGHKCPNCPEASLLAHEIAHDYPEVILISIHAGNFAVPNPSGLFSSDFRTTVGDELNAYFKVGAYPSATVNRSGFQGNVTLASSVWEQAVASFQDFDPVARLQLSGTYDTLSRQLDVTVKTDVIENILSPLQLVVYLTEDSIIRAQNNNNPEVGPTPYITNYVHRHVLRASFNGTFGATLTTGPVGFGTSISRNFSMVLDTAWNAGNCSYVAFIADQTTQEVLQAEQARVILP